MKGVKKTIRKPKKTKFARMDEENRAMCFALRHPPNGGKPAKLEDICKVVWKKDGKHPGINAVHDAAKNYNAEKGTRGKPPGATKTSKAENKKIMDTFHRIRPPGHGVDSRILHDALPRNLQKKISRRTCIRRLAAKGFTPQKKLAKNDPGVALRKRRWKFALKFEDWTKEQWKTEIQAVGDIKTFTWYPKKIYARFKRLRASWTYMTEKEKHKSPFLRPKKWFGRKEWKTTKGQKIFGMTTSNGKVLAILIPSPWDAKKWQKIVKSKVTPFLKKTFPNRRSFKILLDSEQIFHAPQAKAAYREGNISILPGWPKYSPELNPQENVWPTAEKNLRKKECDGGETFEQFQKFALAAVREYEGAKNLVGGMVNKIEQCIMTKGSFIDS